MNWLQRLLGRSSGPEPPVASAEDVRARYTSSLMASTEVVSVGIGRDAGGAPAIVVGVTAAEGEAVALPASIEGIPVIVQTVGTIKTQE